MAEHVIETLSVNKYLTRLGTRVCFTPGKFSISSKSVGPFVKDQNIQGFETILLKNGGCLFCIIFTPVYNNEKTFNLNQSEGSFV